MVIGASLKAVFYLATFQDFPEGHQYRLSLHHYFAAQVSRQLKLQLEFLQQTPEQNLTTRLLRARQPQIPPSPCLEERMGTESLGRAVPSSQVGPAVGADKPAVPG